MAISHIKPKPSNLPPVLSLWPQKNPSPLWCSSVKWPGSVVFKPHSSEPPRVFRVPQDPLRGTVEKEADLALDFPIPSTHQCSCFFSALYAVFPHKDSLNEGSWGSKAWELLKQMIVKVTSRLRYWSPAQESFLVASLGCLSSSNAHGDRHTALSTCCMVPLVTHWCLHVRWGGEGCFPS